MDHSLIQKIQDECVDNKFSLNISILVEVKMSVK